jgi:hypothetical protein
MESLSGTSGGDYIFPKMPSINIKRREANKPVKIVSNYFKISFRPGKEYVRQYAVHYEPEIANDNNHLKRLLMNKLYSQMKETFHPFVSSGDTMFSAKSNDIIHEYETTITFESVEQSYEVTVSPTTNFVDLEHIKSIDKFSQKVKNFIEIVLRNVLNKNKNMIRFNNRNIYDYNKLYQIDSSGKKNRN